RDAPGHRLPKARGQPARRARRLPRRSIEPPSPIQRKTVSHDRADGGKDLPSRCVLGPMTENAWGAPGQPRLRRDAVRLTGAVLMSAAIMGPAVSTFFNPQFSTPFSGQ